MAEQHNAVHDWHIRALVRIRETTTVKKTDGRTITFFAGKEIVLIQLGLAGQPVNRDVWLDSVDTEYAFTIPADKVEVVRVLDKVSPLESS